MVDFLKIIVSSGSIQNTLWISLLAGNVTIHPPQFFYLAPAYFRLQFLHNPNAFYLWYHTSITAFSTLLTF